MYSWAPNFEIFRSIVSICLLTFLTESQFLFNDFMSQKINKDHMDNIINSAIQYSLNFDLEVPKLNDVKIVSVHEILDINNNQKIKTSKRLGFKFSYETNNE